MSNRISLQKWNWAVRYAIALVAVALTLVFRLALNPLLHNTSPFTYFFAAVLISSWLGGLGSGLLATVLSILAVDYYYLPPIYTILGGGPAENFHIISFLILGAVISMIVARLRQERQRAEQATGEARVGETEARRAEAALSESEERFRGTFENAAIGMAHIDLNGNWLLVNPRFCDLVGYSREELEGRKYWDLTHPDDIGMDEAPYAQLIRGDIDQYDMEKRYIAKDGREVWVYISSALQRDSAGKPLYLIASVADITERKRIEESLRMANERLLDADRYKDEFLAMLAHELRNPLAPIRYAAQILNMNGLTQEKIQKQREVIDRQVSHMGRLLDDLLEVSRITRGKIQLKREIVDLRTVAAQALDSMRPMIEGRGQQLDYEEPSSPLPVDGDPTRLEQIIRNLLHNANKYTEAGGCIKISLGLDAMNETEWRAVVRISDSGMGISPEILPHVFEAFVQAEQSLDRTQGGLGIGLAMVKNLVQMHGGSVEAHSTGLGHGSEFTVRLPLAAAALSRLEEVSATEAQSLAAPAKPRRVLVVDDNEDAAASLGDLLKLWGHEVQMAHDGRHALAAAWQWQPEIILLDIGLPGMDGYEVARHLREDPATANVFLVALTGYGQAEDRRRTQEAGFNQHLTKPVALEQLQGLFHKDKT